MESVVTLFMSFAYTFRHKRVLVTGHTGFKGAWLCEWLLALGANVSGFALDPPTKPSLFDQLGLSGRIHDSRGDIREAAAIAQLVSSFRPEYIFHLAAQPIVRVSYDKPVETFSTNVMGTVHLLERHVDSMDAVRSLLLQLTSAMKIANGCMVTGRKIRWEGSIPIALRKELLSS